MDLDCLIALIDKVSASELKSFSMEEGNLRISMKKKKGKLYTAATADGSASAPTTIKTEINEPETDFCGKKMKAPLVGTFYNAPSPEETPFVQVGDAVKKGQVLGIIEAMKLMNEIESEYDGVIEEIPVSNGQMVEYGQTLFVIR